MQEGATLKHCVGGYAKSHASGRIILFIRHERRPERSWYTLNVDLKTKKESTPKDMAGVTAALLSDNEEGVRITSKKLMGWANIDQLSALIEDFLGWMNNTKASNPN